VARPRHVCNHDETGDEADMLKKFVAGGEFSAAAEFPEPVRRAPGAVASRESSATVMPGSFCWSGVEDARWSDNLSPP
jgi:hypothetical protein